MTEVENNKNNASVKKGLILFLLFIVLVLSWTGVGVRYAGDMINDAIVDAGVLYGSARAVNALVSVIQSIDIGAVVATFSPGEALDPINDLVERFSSVMTVAIASLALQKILLYVLEHNIFNILLTLSGISVLLSMVKASKFTPYVLKVFFTLAILRISMAVIIMVNTSVDAAFLEPQVEDDVKKLTSLQNSLSDVASSLDDGNQSTEIDRLESEREQRADERQIIMNDIKDIQATINDLKEKKSTLLSEKAVVDRLNPFQRDDEIEEINKAISQHVDQVSALEASEAIMTQNIDEIDDQIQCAETRAQGGTCSIGEWIGNKVGKIDVRGKIDQVTASAESTIQSVLNLIMMAILKSILLPLLFWWVLYKSIKWVWNDESSFSEFNSPDVPSLQTQSVQ